MKSCFRFFDKQVEQVSVRVPPSVPYCDVLALSPPVYSFDVAVTQGFSDPGKCTISYAAQLGGEVQYYKTI